MHIQPSFPSMMPTSDWRPPEDFPEISGEKFWTIDVEAKDPHLKTRGPGYIRGDAFICGVAIGAPGIKRYYPVRHAQGSNIAPNVVFEWLGDQVKHFRGELYGANLLYDEEGLWYDGVKFHDDVVRRDIQICEPLLDTELQGGCSLEVLSRKYLGIGKDEELLRQAAATFTKGYRDKRARRPIPFDPKKDMWMLPAEFVGAYAEADVDRPMRIYERQAKLIAEEGLQRVLDLESSLTPILLRMRINGVAVDLDQAEALKKLLTTEIDKYSARIKKLVGFDPNVDSSKDMERAYNNIHFSMPELNIQSRLKFTTKGNPSFTSDWYKEQSDPLSRAVHRKKKLMTLRDDFVVGDILKEQVNGRIHAQFNQLRQDDKGTRSGRFSSTNPNLQQVPARHDCCEKECPVDCTSHVWGRDDPNWAMEVRKLFIPDAFKRWLKADYSQQELRLLLHFAHKAKLQGTDPMVAEYRKNPKTDYHKAVQKLVFETCGKNYKRRYIKDANFGLVYGMGFEKLCKKLNLTATEATEFLKAYHGAIPFAKPLAAKAMSVAQERGYVKSLLGRKQRFDLWEVIADSKEERDNKFAGLSRELAEQKWPGRRLQRAGTHKALNWIIQPSAADQTKQAMHDLYYDHGGIVPSLQVHDELNASIGDIWEARTIKSVMEDCILLEIPIVADTTLGTSWGDAKEEVELAA